DATPPPPPPPLPRPEEVGVSSLPPGSLTASGSAAAAAAVPLRPGDWAGVSIADRGERAPLGSAFCDLAGRGGRGGQGFLRGECGLGGLDSVAPEPVCRALTQDARREETQKNLLGRCFLDTRPA
ncbi:hypothetical protein P7K49_016976, partial [Saguinus oedipus]